VPAPAADGDGPAVANGGLPTYQLVHLAGQALGVPPRSRARPAAAGQAPSTGCCTGCGKTGSGSTAGSVSAKAPSSASLSRPVTRTWSLATPPPVATAHRPRHPMAAVRNLGPRSVGRQPHGGLAGRSGAPRPRGFTEVPACTIREASRSPEPGYRGWSLVVPLADQRVVLAACQAASTAAQRWSGGPLLGTKAAAPAWRAACWVSSLSNTE